MTPSPLETKLQELERLATDVVREAHMRPGYIGVSQKAEALKAAITDPSIRTALQDERGRAREATDQQIENVSRAIGATVHEANHRVRARKVIAAYYDPNAQAVPKSQSPPGEAQGWRTMESARGYDGSMYVTNGIAKWLGRFVKSEDGYDATGFYVYEESGFTNLSGPARPYVTIITAVDTFTGWQPLPAPPLPTTEG